MTNKEIAHNLTQIGKILELEDPDKNRFRYIAYERAAQTVSNLTEELKYTYEKGGRKVLDEIEGVGESIAKSIEEMLKTGKLKYLEQLKKENPSNEVEFLQIPGVGPKMAVKIAKVFKAKNIKDLQKRLEKDTSEEIFKEKTKHNILQGIEIMGKLTGRLLITEALPIAEEVVNFVKNIKGVGKCDYVGSLRRSKETVGDIDIVATSSDAKKVIDEFAKAPFIDHLVTQGETKSTIIHWQGVQVDLEIVPEEEYGSLLQHFTGSKEHNIALRTFAQTQNKSVSEHGIKFNGKLHTFTTEKAVYEFLGMDFIPTELREDRGEIEAAIAHQLPKLVELSDIKGDLHVHSTWSDGFMTIEEVAQNALGLGYEYIVISDHTVGLGIAHGLDEGDLKKRQVEIDAVQKKYPNIKILSAVEVNIKANGSLDIRDDMLQKLDIVIASVHTSFRQDKETMTKRIVGAINHPHVDIIGHPSGRLIGQRESYEVDWFEVFKACAQTGTALEISAFPNRLDLRDYLVQSAKDYGVRFSIATDSHQVNHLQNMKYGVAVARRGWCEKSDIVNTKSLADFLVWIKLKND